MKGMIRRVFFVMAVLALLLALTGGAWAALSVSPTTGTTYTDGVLTITGSGTYTITGSGKTQDRIKVNSGITATITINNVYIDLSDPSCTPVGFGPRESNMTGVGRPFDMRGATVTLKLQGTNTFLAANGCTALFCPKGSTLVIEGGGSLTAQTNTGMCVAAIGGEGVLNSGYTHEAEFGKYYLSGNQLDEFLAQLQGYREWYGDDGVCGSITINSGTINANAFVGQYTKEIDDVNNDGKWVYTNITYEWGKDKSSVKNYQGSPIITSGMTAVAIGGADGGPINILGGTVNAKSTVRSTTIGSVSNNFSGGIHIGGTAKVEAINAFCTSGVIAMTDTGTDATYGPAIGWASYDLEGDSNTRIVIDGSAKVVAQCGAYDANTKDGNLDNYSSGSYGGAGIGGGRNGSGGYIEISGNANVEAYGGMKAAGIGGGIAHNPNKSGATMGTGIIIIKGDAQVKAVGGEDAAGIGGGAVRNNVTINAIDASRSYYPSEGQAGTIIIEGNASVTATGGTNGAGIGSGGSDTGNDCYNAGQIQNLIITTTGSITATGGAIANGGSAANIGFGNLKNDSLNNNDGTRVTGIYVNTSTTQSNTAGMNNVPNSITRDSSGNLVVQGTVDLSATKVKNPVVTTSNLNPTPTQLPALDNKLLGQADVISKAIADYISTSGKDIRPTPSASTSGTPPAVTLTGGASIPTEKNSGVSVNGSSVPNVTVTVSSYGNGTVSINGSGMSASVPKGSTVKIKAAPNAGYVFDKWNDNDTNAERNVSVFSSAAFYASFKVAGSGGGTGSGGGIGSGGGGSGQTAGAFYSVRVTSANLRIATVSGGGSSIKSGTQTTVAVNMIDPMYVFDGWYDGETRVSDQETYSFVVTKSVALTACFVRRSDPTTVLGHLKAGIESAADPERIRSRVDKNGPNAVIFNDDGAIAAINSKKHDETTAEPYSVARGESIAIEVFYLNGSTEVLNTSISRTLTMEITSGGARVSALSAEMVDGYAVFEVPTSSLRASSAAEAISVREAERYVAKISDGVGDVMLIVPFMVEGHNDDSQTGGGSGGGGCSAGAAVLVTIASLAMTKRRSR